MSNTNQQYDQVIAQCREIFEKKTKDYGTAWRILRPTSLTDQLDIKASRIRTVQEKGAQKIGDSIESEFKGIVNYCLMALVQLELGRSDEPDFTETQALDWYDKKTAIAKALMLEKNHDYGEAWRKMRVTSITDLILQKLIRVKSIENNEGKTLISEGIDANYLDMINYAVFALILMEEEN